MAENSVQVIYTDPGGEGYHCVYYMARLAAELLEGELVVVKAKRPTVINKLSGILAPRKSPHLACLLICPSPTDLNSILIAPDWRKNYGRTAAWVFDSFWTENIPTWVRSSRIFDHLFVTEHEDLGVWRRTVRAPVDWLPWGSDVLNLGSPAASRRFDLLRFGRQPSEWDSDPSNRDACEAMGLSFQGRPPSYSEAIDNERGLMRLLAEAKFTLAFTNRVSSSIQTHSGREYITGRWTDSLAAGAIVAGMPPESESVRSLLWPEALLDVGTPVRKDGLQVIASAVGEWTPARAQLNYLKSLEVLDWRWRLRTIADTLGIRSSRLESELARLHRVMEQQSPAPSSGEDTAADRGARTAGATGCLAQTQ